jgi:spore coat polysaccharide biosynthesis protein SpsF
VLRAIDELATDHHRVHVTSYIYTHADDFDVIGLTIQPDLSHLRLTVDTEDDWKLVSAIVGHFGDEPVPLRELTAWLASRPDLVELNAHVLQKALVQA